MPNTSSARKKLRADARKAKVNKLLKERVKEAWKSFTSTPSKESLREVNSAFDKAVKRHLIDRPKSDRKKSQAAKLLQSKSRSSSKTTTQKKRKANSA